MKWQPRSWWRAWSRTDSEIVLEAAPEQVVLAMNSTRYGPIAEPRFEVQRSIRSGIRITGTFDRRQSGCHLRLSAVTGGLDWVLMALTAASVVVVAWILVVSAIRILAFDQSWSRELSGIAIFGAFALGLLSLQPLFLRVQLAQFRATLKRSLRASNPTD